MKNLALFLPLVAFCWGCNGDNALEPVSDEGTGTTEVANARLNIELKSQEKTWVLNGNSFAMRLFDAICEDSEEENVLISPLSLQIALGMLSNGANETGLNEITSVLGFENYSQDEVNNYFGKLISSLAEGDPSVNLNQANSAWIQNDYVIQEAFIQAFVEHYSAQVNRVDFSQAAEVKKMINDWCSEQTAGKINNLDLSINDFTRLVLANAFYLKGSWTIPFNSVEKGTFTTSEGEKQDVDLMKLENTFNYNSGTHYQAVELPYGNESFSMVAVLPAEGKSVEEAAVAIDWEHIRFGGRQVEVAMPKFKLGNHVELAEILKKMGIKEVFRTLPNIASDLFVSRVFQDMYIETNETGTEAAAVTVIGIDIAGGPDSPAHIEMKMDRPFLFVIRENSTGIILFMGKVGSVN
ncbi:MAG: serpin family protein [Tannerella sp.]|jgi:serpin B|nr:serpin family protein [Tannerella sp.]